MKNACAWPNQTFLSPSYVTSMMLCLQCVASMGWVAWGGGEVGQAGWGVWAPHHSQFIHYNGQGRLGEIYSPYLPSPSIYNSRFQGYAPELFFNQKTRMWIKKKNRPISTVLFIGLSAFELVKLSEQKVRGSANTFQPSYCNCTWTNAHIKWIVNPPPQTCQIWHTGVKSVSFTGERGVQYKLASV